MGLISRVSSRTYRLDNRTRVTMKSLLLITLTAIAYATQDINEKVQNLHELSKSQGLIKINSDKFDLYVRQRPRNYSVIAMTTALNPARGCSVCGEAYEEYKILYQSYRRFNHDDFMANKVFFILVDYDEAAEVFQSLKLNSAPGFFHFPASGSKTNKAQDKLDIQRKGYQADQLSKWVADRTGVALGSCSRNFLTQSELQEGFFFVVISVGCRFF